MSEQMRPASDEEAPDPSNNYERSHPGREAGMGRLDNNKAVPADSPDQIHKAVSNRQDGSRQINAHETENQHAGRDLQPPQPQQSMLDEEPLGWDQAPTDIKDSQQKRHSRTEGRGGTP